LATLGFRGEAFALLKSWLKDADFDRRIDAAETLCLIGERPLGVRSLKRLIKNRNLGADVRLQAANSLERVDETNAAEKAYLLLLRDASLSIEERCRATRYFDQESNGHSEAIWEVMVPLLVDDGLALRDRSAIAKTLRGMSSPDWGDFDHEDVLDELFSIVGVGNASGADVWNIVGVLARAKISISDIPGAVKLADDASIPVGARVEGLQKFVLYSNDRVAAQKLFEIAQTPELSYAHAINALSYVSIEETRERVECLLRRIINDPKSPPAWRLKAASGKGERRYERGSNDGTISVIRDAKVSTWVRLAALRDLKSVLPDRQAALLSEIAGTPQLDALDRLYVAEAALEAEATELGRTILTDVLADTPHSIAEMAKMAKLLHAMGSKQEAFGLLKDITDLPDIVLRETEEHSCTVEAAELLDELGHSKDATRFLVRLVEPVSWHDVKDILEGIGRIAGEGEARQAALKLLPQVIAERNDPSSGYLGYWRDLFEEFLTKGWTEDLTPLLLAVRDPSKLLSDRAEAAAAIYRNSSRDASRNWTDIAQGALAEFSERKDLSARERVILIPIFNACGLETLAKGHIEALVSTRDLAVEDRRALAILLSELGDKKRAKETLQGIGEDQEATGFLGPSDEKVIEDLQGEEHLRHIRVSRAFNEREPIMDRLFDARDMVSEYGDKQALQLIFKAAYDEQLDPNDRLQAIEVMEELGYRDIPLKLLPDILTHPQVDDYWAGDLLLRFGDKAGALERFRKAIKTCPEHYRDQIARRLADLQAIGLLEELSERCVHED
jgi:tetratricopeptide (TPR) repeat protein